MFEKYTEKARRVIFFARYEASQFGSQYIETEHLLLGILREDKGLVEQVHLDSDATRKGVEARIPIRERFSTAVDLPLSHSAKRALAYGAEEAQKLGHDFIGTGHLLLGLMREKKTPCSIILREQGLEYEEVRKIVRESAPNAPPTRAERRARLGGIVRALGRQTSYELPNIEVVAPSLQPLVFRLQELVEGAFQHASYSDAYGQQQLKRKPWSRNQALGHLIDYATTHQQWLARALTEPQLRAHAYPLEEWVTAQQYQTFSWHVLMDLWVALNTLLIHIMAAIPDERLKTACQVGIDEPIPLRTLIERYVGYQEDLMDQILAKL